MDFHLNNYKKIILVSALPIVLAACGKSTHFSYGDSAENWDQQKLAHPDHETMSEEPQSDSETANAGIQDDRGTISDETSHNHEAIGEENHSHLERSTLSGELSTLGCVRATAQQINVINAGNGMKDEFLNYCLRNTGNSNWCQQLVRPNPDSKSIFSCTYGSDQVHQLIYPDKNIWAYPIGAVQLIQKLEQKGLKICEIYNWWRPEPYNKNVDGAAGRHPYGTAVDVRFCSSSDAIKGFDELCKYRQQGLIRAIGYYGGAGVHFGVGDKTANTWGRSCK